MRVVVVTPHLPPVYGGIATFSGELIEGLKKLGVDAWGVANQGEDSDSWQIVRGGSLRFASAVFVKLLRRRPDVVHAHSHWYALLPAAALRILRPSTRVVFTFHTPPTARARLADSIVRTLLATCTAVTYVSRDLETQYPPWSRTHHFVIYPAPETRVLSPQTVCEDDGLLHVADRLIVGFVGPFAWPQKVEGVRRLVEAFGRTLDSQPRALLAIAGDGPLRSEIERQAKKILGSNVVFLGNVKNIRALMNRFDIYAHISLQEGMPLSLLNAMALGRAVLASNSGGIPEAVRNEETGLLVPSSVDAISAGLERLMSDPALRSRLGASAARFVQDRFSWEKTIRGFQRCYEVPA